VPKFLSHGSGHSVFSAFFFSPMGADISVWKKWLHDWYPRPSPRHGVEKFPSGKNRSGRQSGTTSIFGRFDVIRSCRAATFLYRTDPGVGGERACVPEADAQRCGIQESYAGVFPLVSVVLHALLYIIGKG